MKTKKLTLKRIVEATVFSALFMFGSLVAFAQEEGEYKKPSKYDKEDNVFIGNDEDKTKSDDMQQTTTVNVNNVDADSYNPEYWNDKYDGTFDVNLSANVDLDMNTVMQAGVDLETTHREKEQKVEEIYDIAMNYPDFEYEYEYDGDEVEDVNISGVDNPEDEEKLNVLLIDLYSFNKNLMNQQETATGVYYVTEDEAEPKEGYQDFFNNLYSNLNYPEAAENRGVEGTMYVKFIVDENGEISNINVDHNIDTPYEQALELMEITAKEAVQETSGNWEAATIGGQKVSEYVVVPVTFDFEINPTLKAPIR